MASVHADRYDAFMRITFRPNALSLLFLLLTLGILTALSTSGHMTVSMHEPEEAVAWTTHGVGDAVVIERRADSSEVSIRWGALLLNLLAAYAVAQLAAAAVRVMTRLKRPGLVYAGAVVGIFGLACIAGMCVSRYYWGYFVSRPSLPPAASEIASVTALVPVWTEPDGTGRLRFVVDGEFSLSGEISYAKQRPYMCLDERILVDLDRRGLLGTGFSGEIEELPRLYSLIAASGELARAEEGYEDAALLEGVVVDGRDHENRRVIFAGLRGQQVSNDHYPCYEFVFRDPPSGAGPELVFGQRFFFDVAGMEGFEWPLISLALLIPGLLLGLPLLTVGLWIRSLRARRRTGASPAAS